MHIAIVSSEFPPDIGGVETYAFEYSRALVSLGHKVTVYTRRHQHGEVDLPGLVVKPILTMRLHQDRRLLANEKADAWHAMNAAYACLVKDKPRLIVSVHGNDFLRPYLPLVQPDWKHWPLGWRLEPHLSRWFRDLWVRRTAQLMRQSLPKLRHILTNSRYTEDALLGLFPACQGRTETAYVGVAEQFFSVVRQPCLNGITRLLTVCRLSEPRKNIEPVLRALARLGSEFPFKYTIVGDGKDRARLESICHSLGLGSSVHFTGQVTQQQLLEQYSSADLFILTSSIIPNSHEGFGIVYLEAAASGVPALAARLAGAAEAVKDGVSGMFVAEPTEKAIEEALRQFLTGSKQFDAEECRAFARSFTWQRVVERALPYY